MTFLRIILLTIIAGIMLPMLGMLIDSKSSANASTPNQQSLISLEKSIAPLRDHFNANKDKYRFVALLSPT